MTCIMWPAASPPCSCGQPRVSQRRSASFPWNERRNSQRSSPASPSAPAPPQSAGSSRRRNSRISPRNLSPPGDLPAFRLDPSRLRTLIATGDVIPARHTDVVIRSRGDDFLYTVATTKEITAAADLTVLNLEAPLGEGCPHHHEGFQFF